MKLKTSLLIFTLAFTVLAAKEVPVLSQRRVNTYAITIPDSWKVATNDSKQFVAGSKEAGIWIHENHFADLKTALSERDRFLNSLFKGKANLEGRPTPKQNEKFQYQYDSGFVPEENKQIKNVSSLVILSRKTSTLGRPDESTYEAFHGFILVCTEPGPSKGKQIEPVCDSILKSMRNTDKNMGGKKAFKLLSEKDSF
jgi:hypothetical protein